MSNWDRLRECYGSGRFIDRRWGDSGAYCDSLAVHSTPMVPHITSIPPGMRQGMDKEPAVSHWFVFPPGLANAEEK